MTTVLITGATSGIGEEFAKRYAALGYRLILVARRVERMEALAKTLSVETRIIKADLSDELQCKKLVEDVSKEDIDIFINNAGFGTCGLFTETDLDKEISMIHVNDIAMHILFKGILKQMVKRDRGHILNVCSSAGLLAAGPYMATYYASKAYMVSLSRAVRQELKEMGSKVVVSALCPGPVDTEFNDNADVIFALKGISAAQCVDEALKGMNRKKLIIVPAFIMKCAMIFQRLLPMNILVAMTSHQQKKKM